VEIVRRLFERWGRGDFNTPEAFDQEVEFARIGGDIDVFGITGEWHGIDALWSAVALWLREWDNMRLQAERIIEVADRVLVIARTRGVGKRSGAPLDHVEAEVLSFRDGRIVRWEAHWDPVEAMRSLGLRE
jgi:ketosteroid isomerase-like protein